MAISTLGDLIRVNAERYSDDVAFICGARTSTFAQFNSRVNRLIDALTAQGLKKGDRLVILSTNRIEFAEAYGAAEKGGFIAVPLNHRLLPDDVALIVADAEASAIIVEDQLEFLTAGVAHLPRFVFSTEAASTSMSASASPSPSPLLSATASATAPSSPGHAVSSYEALIAQGRDIEPAVRIDPHDVVYMMYTGGTTGRSKGVLLDHYGQINNAKATMIEASMMRGDKLLSVMPMNHIGAKNFAIPHFHRGTAHVLMPRFDARELLDLLVSQQVRCTLLAPTMIKMILDELGDAPFVGGCLKTIYYSSAPMPASLLRQAIAKFGRVFMQFYGLTGCGPGASVLLKDDHLPDGTPSEQRRLTSAGRPMMYTEVQVVDDADRVLPPGQVGEVRIRGEQIMQGYWRNPTATAETLRHGWIYSGDYGQIDTDGYVYVVGRKKDVIISGGENIYPREIEELLSAHPAVREVAVVGAPDEKWGEVVTAVIVLNDGHTLSADEVVAHCRAHLASYKKPRQVHFWPALPRSSLGKIVKSDIRGHFWANKAG